MRIREHGGELDSDPCSPSSEALVGVDGGLEVGRDVDAVKRFLDDELVWLCDSTCAGVGPACSFVLVDFDRVGEQSAFVALSQLVQ